jgi:Putative collagen-binding domain of a collagenase
MRDSGVVAHMWFFADDSGFGNLPDADRQRLIKYAMARHSAYVNTMYVVALEWQEGWTTTEVTNHANFLHANNPWARLVTVHGTPGNFAFPTAGWADYMDIQAGNSASHGTVHKNALYHYSVAQKPHIQEEHGLGQEDTVHRQRAWGAFTGGAGGVGTGSYLKHLVTFTEQVYNWHVLDPADSLVKSGAAYGMANAGNAYVFYLYNGGTVSVDLTRSTGTLVVQWYDPRTGVFKAAPSVTGGAARSFTAPGSGDWVLYIRK